MHLPPKEKLTAIVAGVILLGGVSYAGMSRLRPDDPLRVEAISPRNAVAIRTTPRSTPASDLPETIVVDMAGEVVHPGNVTLPPTARVDDAVKAAGGLKPTADFDAVNFAAKLTDGEQIYVPPKRQKSGEESQPTETKPKRRQSGKSSRGSKKSAPGGQPAPHTAPIQDHSKRGPTLREIYGDDLYERTVANNPELRGVDGSGTGDRKVVSLNNCREEDLLHIPEIGHVTARRIIDYRQQKGGFHSIDELLSVEGIGPKKFQKMKPYLKL